MQCIALTVASMADDNDFSEDEWEVQEWRAESFDQDCFLEEQRRKLQVNCMFRDQQSYYIIECE